MIQPKYEIGDKVFVGDYGREMRKQECPDCLGHRIWLCRLPTGEKLNIPCPTCSYGYDGSRGWVEDYTYEPKVWLGTVGSVRIDTNSKDEPISYMLTDTGVGSGRVYKEDALFKSESEATNLAVALAENMRIHILEANATTRHRKRNDRAGSLVAYLRADIREAQKKIKDTTAHLARISPPVEEPK